MNSLRHLSDELLKESLRNATELKLEPNFCTALKNEIKKREERSQKGNTKAMDITTTFEW
ncbi:sporulation histidine kinase inhibitor Sda [Oceanobacillus sojae]|uniref:sporulation histidine kinase inhibitor Sda n=1 Tax=Oceanobacillus sojae TaxID=582851 RepID=UPI000988951B|nr:sporulation histidine kinase inhibitor Sda [Oceanobacillus sojae]